MTTNGSFSDEPLGVFGKGWDVLTVQFYPDTANAPTAVTGAFVHDVAHTSTGKFTITFEQALRATKILPLSAYVYDNGNVVARVAKIGLIDDAAAAATAVVYVLDDALAVADVAAHANSRVIAHFLVKRNPVKDASGFGGV